MSIKVKMDGDIAVVSIKGNLMGDKMTDTCHKKIKDLLEDGQKKIIVDLSAVKWMNSKGLGMLMACFTSAKNADSIFKVASASKKVKSLFMITKLNTIFDAYDTVEEAVESFKK